MASKCSGDASAISWCNDLDDVVGDAFQKVDETSGCLESETALR